MKYNILLFFVLMHTFCFGKHQSILDLATKFFNNGQYDSAHYYLDQIFESDPNNTSAIKLRADTYSYQGDNLKAIDNYQRFIYLEKNKISPDYNLLSFVQNSLSWTYYAMGLYSKSIEIYRMALKTALAANDSIEMATAYSGLSNNFARLAKYDSAIEYIRQAYDLDLALGDSSSLSSDLNSLGFLLGSKGDFEKAIYYYETSLEYLKPGELNKRAFRFNNLGMMKIELALYDEARQDIEQSLKLHRALGDSLKAAERKMNLAKLFNKTGQFNLAYDYINYAINHFVEAQHKALEIRGRITLATMLIDQKKWNLAESELQKCIALASEKELLEEMVRAFKLLVSVYDAQNRIAEAYATLKEYQVYSDSLKKSDQLKSINDLEFKFVTDIKEKEIELLQLSKAKSETELKSKSRENTILLIVGIVIMIVFVVLSIFQRQKFRLKQALLSQEIDTLRVQINALFGGGVSELNISLDQINKGLYKPISEREFEILKYAMSDKNNSEIAEAVFLSVNTVKFHLRNIYEKLGVSNRKEALELILSKS